MDYKIHRYSEETIMLEEAEDEIFGEQIHVTRTLGSGAPYFTITGVPHQPTLRIETARLAREIGKALCELSLGAMDKPHG